MNDNFIKNDDGTIGIHSKYCTFVLENEDNYKILQECLEEIRNSEEYNRKPTTFKNNTPGNIIFDLPPRFPCEIDKKIYISEVPIRERMMNFARVMIFGIGA